MEVLDTVSAVLKEKGSSVWSVPPETTVYEALELIALKNIGAVLVMEGDRLLGVFSEREYARRIVLAGRSSKATKIREVMVSEPLTISPDASVDDAMRKMTDHRVRHLPVVDRDNRVVGIMSIGDVVKWIITAHERTIEQLQNYISGQYDVPVAYH